MSPDGKWIAYTDSQVEKTYLVSSGGGRPWLLPGSGRPVRWSSTSRHLLSVDQGKALYVTDITTRRRITIDQGLTVFGASFSPSGAEVVWGRGRSGPDAFKGDIDIFRARIDGSRRVRLTHRGKNSYPVWGRRGVAYSRVRSSGDRVFPIYELWMMQPVGQKARRITRSSHGPVEWSVDGRWLLTSTSRTSGAVLSVIDMESEVVRPLLQGQLVIPLGLSKDGRSVLAWALSSVRKPEGDLVRVGLDGRRVLLVKDAGQGAHWNQ